MNEKGFCVPQVGGSGDSGGQCVLSEVNNLRALNSLSQVDSRILNQFVFVSTPQLRRCEPSLNDSGGGANLRCVNFMIHSDSLKSAWMRRQERY